MTLDRESILVGLRKVGAPGLAALAILAGCAWAEWGAGPQVRAETSTLHAQALAERDRKEAVRPVDSAQQALAATYARLPDDRSSNSTLEDLLKSAKAQGLVTDAVQFHTEASRLPGVIRHQVQVPVKGSYPALRSWISNALREGHGLSLDSLQIKRKEASTGELEAQTSWSLWADSISGSAPAHVD